MEARNASPEAIQAMRERLAKRQDTRRFEAETNEAIRMVNSANNQKGSM